MTEIDEATDNEMDNTFNVDGNISSRIGVGLKSVSILGSNELHTKKFDKFAFAKKFEITKDEVCFMTEPILELQQLQSFKSSKYKLKKRLNQEIKDAHWHEVLTLHYEGANDKKKEKQFSIEVLFDCDGAKERVGKRQTFMLAQFKNGQIFEKEINLGT